MLFQNFNLYPLPSQPSPKREKELACGSISSPATFGEGFRAGFQYFFL